MKKVAWLAAALAAMLFCFTTGAAQAAKMSYIGQFVAEEDGGIVPSLYDVLTGSNRTLLEGKPGKVCLVKDEIFDEYHSTIEHEKYTKKCSRVGWLYDVLTGGEDKGEYLIARQVAGKKKYDCYLLEVETEEAVATESEEATEEDSEATDEAENVEEAVEEEDEVAEAEASAPSVDDGSVYDPIDEVCSKHPGAMIVLKPKKAGEDGTRYLCPEKSEKKPAPVQVSNDLVPMDDPHIVQAQPIQAPAPQPVPQQQPTPQPAPQPAPQPVVQPAPVPIDYYLGPGEFYKTLTYWGSKSGLNALLTANGLVPDKDHVAVFSVCIDNAKTTKASITSLKFFFKAGGCKEGVKGKTTATFIRYYLDDGQLAGVTMHFPEAKNPEMFELYGVVYVPMIAPPVITPPSAPEAQAQVQAQTQATASAVDQTKAEIAALKAEMEELKKAQVEAEEKAATAPAVPPDKSAECTADLWRSVDPALTKAAVLVPGHIFGATLPKGGLMAFAEDKDGYFYPLQKLELGNMPAEMVSCRFSDEAVKKIATRFAFMETVDLSRHEVGVTFRHKITTTDSARGGQTTSREATDGGRVVEVLYPTLDWETFRMEVTGKGNDNDIYTINACLDIVQAGIKDAKVRQVFQDLVRSECPTDDVRADSNS